MRGPPPYRTPLLGRDELLARLLRLLRGGGALVTAVGPGGVGKTRLAAEVGQALGGGTVFVDLTGASDGDAVHAAALAAAGTSEAGPAAASARAVAALGAKGPALVILDNAEQVVGPARALAEALVAAHPTTSVLVTSRMPLDSPHERRVEVPPLDVPDVNVPLVDQPAVQVLLHGLPIVATTPGLVPADVAALVAATDGLPLALELAGARLSVLDPKALVAGIGRTARTLADPARRGRHASMDAAIRWSWDLASPAEREALHQLHRFVGTFDLRAAAAVMGLGLDDAADVLHGLVSTSWLRPEVSSAGARRFRLWETVRGFLQGLREPPSAGVDERFQAHFAERAAEFARRAVGEGFFAELGAADPDLRNVLAAIDLGGPAAAQIAADAYSWLIRRLDRRVCAELWLRAVEQTRDPTLRVTLLRRAADDFALLGRVERAVEVGERARAAVGPETPVSMRASVALTLATAQLHAGACRAAADTLAEVAHLAPEVDPVVRARLLMDLGNLAHDLGRADEAAGWIGAAGPVVDALAGHAVWETYSLRLGILQLRALQVDLGDARLAQLVAADGVARFPLTLSAAWCYRGAAAWLRGDDAAAELAWVEMERSERPGIHLVVHRMIRAGASLARAPERAGHDADVALAQLDRHDHATLETYCRPVLRGVLAVLRGPQAPSPSRRTAEVYPFVPDAARAVDELVEGRADTASGRAVADRLESLRSFEATLFAAVVRGAAAVAERRESTWLFHPDGIRFRPPGGPWVDLSRKGRLSRMVRALLAGPEPLPVSALFEAVWSGERVLPASAANRVRVAASQLRSLGLTIVRYHGGGYRLDPDAPVRIGAED